MKEVDFDSVGKRLPYSIPEGFIESAKSRALTISARDKRSGMRILYRVAIAAAVVLAVCGAAVWLEGYTSPESRYERMLADVSSEVLWEYACEYDTSGGEYLY